MIEGDETTKEKEESSVDRVLYISAMILGLFVFDFSLAYLSLPSISLDLHATVEIRWLVFIYFLPAIGVIALIDPFLKRWDIHRLALIGVSIFTIGSALCATALLFWQLVLYRLLQGIGGAFLIVFVWAMATKYLKEKKRVLLLSVIGFVGGMVGSILGGVLIEYWSWHTLFLLQIPIGLLIYYLCLGLLPKDKFPFSVSIDKNFAGWLIASLMLMVIGFSPYAEFGGIPTILFLLIGLAVFVYVLIKKRKTEQWDLPKEKILLSFVASFYVFLGSSLIFTLPFFLAKELGMRSIQIGFLLFLLCFIVLSIVFIRERWLTRITVYQQLWISFTFVFLGIVLFLSTDRLELIRLVLAVGLLGISFGFFSMRFYLGSLVQPSVQASILILVSWLLGPMVCTLIWTPNMLETLSNRVDLQLVFYLLILVVVSSSILLLGAMRIRVSKGDKNEGA